MMCQEIPDAAQRGATRSSMKPNRAAAAGGLRKAGNRDTDPLGPNSEIGRKLKQYYDELVSETVPDRFTDLLSQLEERERPAGAGDGE